MVQINRLFSYPAKNAGSVMTPEFVERLSLLRWRTHVMKITMTIRCLL